MASSAAGIGPFGAVGARAVWAALWVLYISFVNVGQTFYAFDKMKRLVEDAGYVDVEERTFKWPIGQWARTPKMKDIGRFFKMAWQFGMEAWVLRPATNDLNVCVSLSCCEVITDIQTEGRGTRNRMTLLTNYLISSGQKNG